MDGVGQSGSERSGDHAEEGGVNGHTSPWAAHRASHEAWSSAGAALEPPFEPLTSSWKVAAPDRRGIEALTGADPIDDPMTSTIVHQRFTPFSAITEDPYADELAQRSAEFARHAAFDDPTPPQGMPQLATPAPPPVAWSAPPPPPVEGPGAGTDPPLAQLTLGQRFGMAFGDLLGHDDPFADDPLDERPPAERATTEVRRPEPGDDTGKLPRRLAGQGLNESGYPPPEAFVREPGLGLPPADPYGHVDPSAHGLPPADSLGRGLPPADSLGRGLPAADSLGRGLPPADSLGRGLPAADSLGRGLPSTDSFGGAGSSDSLGHGGLPQGDSLGRGGSPMAEAFGRGGLPQADSLGRGGMPPADSRGGLPQADSMRLGGHPQPGPAGSGRSQGDSRGLPQADTMGFHGLGQADPADLGGQPDAPGFGGFPQSDAAGLAGPASADQPGLGGLKPVSPAGFGGFPQADPVGFGGLSQADSVGFGGSQPDPVGFGGLSQADSAGFGRSQFEPAGFDGVPQADSAGLRAPQADSTGSRAPQADSAGSRAPQADSTGLRAPQAGLAGLQAPHADSAAPVAGKAERPERTGSLGRFSRARDAGLGGPRQENAFAGTDNAFASAGQPGVRAAEGAPPEAESAGGAEAEDLPQRIPAEPDVPAEVKVQADEASPLKDKAQLSRIASHLRREDVPPAERPDGFDVQAVLAAVRAVAGVREASMRTTQAGAHHLRLELAEGADPGEISRMVARMLQDQMGIDAALMGGPGQQPAIPAQAEPGPEPQQVMPPRPRSGNGAAPPPATERPDPLRGDRQDQANQTRRRHPVSVPRRPLSDLRPSERAAATWRSNPENDQVGGNTPPAIITDRETGPRAIIDHVQTSTFGLDATVEVRLTSGERNAVGVSSGPAVDAYVLRLCAAATAAAVDDLLRDGTSTGETGRCFIEHAAIVPMGSCDVAVVVVLLVCGGWVEQLAGSALVSGDPRRAVVRATLSAVNRRLAALLP